MTGSDYLIAVDIGTTSAKALLYRIDGDIERMVFKNYLTYYPEPGLIEQDPDEILDAVVEVIQGLIREAGINPRSILGISFGGVWQSMFPVDRSGKALGRAMTWADSRAFEQSERLRNKLDVKKVRRDTGCTIHPMYFLPRILWFQEKRPEVYQKTYKFISIKEYIIYHLFGVFQVDKSIASGTGIWRMATMDWDDELLETVKTGRDRFSEVIEPTAILGGLKPDYAARMGLLAGTPGIAGAADGALSHLGSVGLAEDKMSLTVGTGAALRRQVSGPQVLPDAEAWCYYLTENHWLLGGVVQDAGNVMKWFADNLLDTVNSGEDVFELLNQYAGEIEPGAEGLIFLPFLGGERCPHYRPDARGLVYGMTFAHGKKHLVRALMEGIAFRLYSVYCMLAGETEPEIIVSGGLLKSPVWLKLTADFFGKRLWRPGISEASAWGATLIGLRALNIINQPEEMNRWVKLNGNYEPDIKAHCKYKDVYSSYLNLYLKLFI